MWLTIPVNVKGKYFQSIKEMTVNDPEWNRSHWKTIVHCYAKARYFSSYREVFEDLYLNTMQDHLSRINYRFLDAICRLLVIKTKLSWSMDYELIGDRTERLVNLCKQAGGTEYLSGPAAKAYLNEDLFRQENISISYIDYSGYDDYHQLYPPFEPHVSIIDLIFNEGPNVAKYMKSSWY